MPPKIKVTKEMILEATLKMTKEQGFEQVNARSLAKEIGCSTQPIFSHYASMNDLKGAFYHYLEKYYDEFMMNRMKGENVFRNIGLAYIEFAKQEKHFFKLLFMSEFMGLNSFSDMFEDGNLEVAHMVSKNLSISLEDAKSLYMKIWIFTHGIASMIATDSIHLSDEEASNMMREAYEAFLLQVKMKQEK